MCSSMTTITSLAYNLIKAQNVIPNIKPWIQKLRKHKNRKRIAHSPRENSGSMAPRRFSGKKWNYKNGRNKKRSIGILELVTKESRIIEDKILV